VTKAGCKMADSGSVLFNFERQGLLFVPAGISEDEVSLVVLCVLASQPVLDVLPCTLKFLKAQPTSAACRLTRAVACTSQPPATCSPRKS
jgi:hypothetical protein